MEGDLFEKQLDPEGLSDHLGQVANKAEARYIGRCMSADLFHYPGGFIVKLYHDLNRFRHRILV